MTIEYRRRSLRADDPPGSRVVHNVLPYGRGYSEDGFRYWVTDEPMGHRCYCNWSEAEHYGTVQWQDANGTVQHLAASRPRPQPPN
jgi:hypothetical protein